MNVDRLLSEEEQSLITQAVTAAERNTIGEIVPVIVPAADPYYETHYAGALLGFLLFSIIAFALRPFIPALSFETEHVWGNAVSFTAGINIAFLIVFQVFGLIAGFIAAWLIPPLKRILSLPSRLEEEVMQRAYQAFLEHNLHSTQAHTGVLIFISVFERRVVILGDTGINEKIPPKFWDEQVQTLVEEIKAGRTASGIITLIESCGRILERHFPSDGTDNNELSDGIRVEE